PVPYWKSHLADWVGLAMYRLPSQAEFSEQGGKSWVADQLSPPRLNAEERQEHVPRLHRGFELVQRFFAVPECKVDQREVRGRHIGLCGPRLQLVENGPGFLASSAGRQRVACGRPNHQRSAQL